MPTPRPRTRVPWRSPSPCLGGPTRRRLGASLVEPLVALALLAMAGGALLRLLSTADGLLDRSRLRQGALERQVEAVHDLTDGACQPVGSLEGNWIGTRLWHERRVEAVAGGQQADVVSRWHPTFPAGSAPEIRWQVETWCEEPGWRVEG